MRTKQSPLLFRRGDYLVEFVASRRQQILEILREFQVVSLTQAGSLVDVAWYSLTAQSKGRVAPMRCSFEDSSEFTNRPIADQCACRRNASERKRQFLFKIISWLLSCWLPQREDIKWTSCWTSEAVYLRFLPCYICRVTILPAAPSVELLGK